MRILILLSVSLFFFGCSHLTSSVSDNTSVQKSRGLANTSRDIDASVVETIKSQDSRIIHIGVEEDGKCHSSAKSLIDFLSKYQLGETSGIDRLLFFATTLHHFAYSASVDETAWHIGVGCNATFEEVETLLKKWFPGSTLKNSP